MAFLEEGGSGPPDEYSAGISRGPSAVLLLVYTIFLYWQFEQGLRDKHALTEYTYSLGLQCPFAYHMF
jgi:hypothetical protein